MTGMGERFYSYGPYVNFLHRITRKSEQYHILTTHIKQNNNSCGMKSTIKSVKWITPWLVQFQDKMGSWFYMRSNTLINLGAWKDWFASQKAPLFIRPKFICILLTHDVLGLQLSDTENKWKQFKRQTFHLFWELQWTYDPIPAYQFV